MVKMKGKTRIVIKGHLDIQWKNHFDGLKIRQEAGSTILSGFHSFIRIPFSI